jgi:hypothetical protein
MKGGLKVRCRLLHAGLTGDSEGDRIFDATPTHPDEEGVPMAVAKVTAITALSHGFEDAIQAGISRAGKTLENIGGAWSKDTRFNVANGRVSE